MKSQREGIQASDILGADELRDIDPFRHTTKLLSAVVDAVGRETEELAALVLQVLRFAQFEGGEGSLVGGEDDGARLEDHPVS